MLIVTELLLESPARPNCFAPSARSKADSYLTCGVRVAAALSYSRWAMEMLTVVEYAGLDSSRQHLAMFQLAQMVRINP